jgi:hypothetical protein
MKKIIVIVLLISPTILIASARVRSCTAIPGRAKGQGATGGDAYCGSQKQPDGPQEIDPLAGSQGSDAVLGAVGDVTIYTAAQINALSPNAIHLNDDKPITTSVSASLQLPLVGEKKIIEYIPSTGPMALKKCQVIIEGKPLTAYAKLSLPADQRKKSYKITLYRLQQEQKNRSTFSVIEIMNAIVSDTSSDSSPVTITMEPDGSSHILLKSGETPLNLPTGVSDEQFLAAGRA